MDEAEQDSLLAKHLLQMAILSSFRGLSPEMYFNDKPVPALEMNIEKLIPIDAESRRLIDCIMGEAVYDALQKKYLKTLLFCVCEAVDGPMIEEYAFSFRYVNSDSQEVSMNINKTGGTVKCNSTTYITPDQMRGSACQMVRTLVQLMRTMDKMPNERIILMKLFYYDDVTPAHYEPSSFFQGCSREDVDNPRSKSSLKMEVGNLNGKPLVLALNVKRVLDLCEHENDENRALVDDGNNINKFMCSESTQDPTEDEHQFVQLKDRINSHNGGTLPNYNPLERREACKDKKDTNRIIVQAQSSSKSAATTPLPASYDGQQTGSLNQTNMVSKFSSSTGSNASVVAERATYEQKSCRSFTSIVAMSDNEGVVIAVDSRESMETETKVFPVSDKRQKLVEVRPTIFLAGTGLCSLIDGIGAEIHRRFNRGKAKNSDMVVMDEIAQDVLSNMLEICRQRRVDLTQKENGFDFVLIGTTQRSAGIYLLQTVDSTLKLEKSRKGLEVKKFITVGSGTPAMQQYLKENKQIKDRVDYCKSCIEYATKEDEKKTGGRYIIVVELRKCDNSSRRGSRRDNKPPPRGFRYTYEEKVVSGKKTYDMLFKNEIK